MMSGHSKWATTKHKKAIIDAKRGKVFTKMAKLVTIAARDGGSGDPSSNPSLRMAIDNAKAQSMPKENIERAILHGTGESAGANIESITYEAYGPNKVAILIECLTDNKNRALSDIKAVITKAGGNFASAGSVSYLFQKKGEIIIDTQKNQISSDGIEEAIINSNADDYEIEDGLILIYTNPSQLHQVKIEIEKSSVVVESSELIFSPITSIEIDEKKKPQVISLLEALDDLDDVNKVYTNASL